MAVADTLTRLRKQFADAPAAALSTSSLVMLATAFAATLCAWMFGPSASYKVPLLLFGVAAIILLVLVCQTGIALGVSVLIIGTVVAPEDFLIKIAHIMRSQPGAIEPYLKGYESKPNARPEDVAARIAEKITQGSAGLGEKDKERIENILGEAEKERLTARSPDYPLREIAKGGAARDRLIRDYGDKDFFRRDLEQLQRDHLVICRPSDPTDCAATDLGKEIALRLEQREKRFLDPSSPVSPASSSASSASAIPKKK